MAGEKESDSGGKVYEEILKSLEESNTDPESNTK